MAFENGHSIIGSSPIILASGSESFQQILLVEKSAQIDDLAMEVLDDGKIRNDVSDNFADVENIRDESSLYLFGSSFTKEIVLEVINGNSLVVFLDNLVYSGLDSAKAQTWGV